MQTIFNTPSAGMQEGICVILFGLTVSGVALFVCLFVLELFCGDSDVGRHNFPAWPFVHMRKDF